MKENFDLLAVWCLSIMSFVSESAIVGFFAIVASVTTIIKNLPSVIKFFQNLKSKK